MNFKKKTKQKAKQYILGSKNKKNKLSKKNSLKAAKKLLYNQGKMTRIDSSSSKTGDYEKFKNKFCKNKKSKKYFSKQKINSSLTKPRSYQQSYRKKTLVRTASN